MINFSTVQQPNLSHPFHLHGYAFNVIGIGRSPDKNVKKINLKHALDLDKRGLLNRQFNLPPAKDTIAVPNNGYVIFRFRADNPGERNCATRLHVYNSNHCDHSTSFLLFRILAVPLSLLIPHPYRNEFNSTRWNTCRSSTSAAEFPKMRRSPTAHNTAIVIRLISLIHPKESEKLEAVQSIHDIFSVFL